MAIPCPERAPFLHFVPVLEPAEFVTPYEAFLFTHLRCRRRALSGLMFFTTYTLLVLFWAEIYHQARSLPTGALRPAFLITNGGVYAVEVAAWVYSGATGNEGLAVKLSASFIATVNLLAAAGFLVYGGRLFIMLRRFPIESKGRRKKLREVGFVTAICATCFTLRAVLVATAAISRRFGSELDVVDHPLINVSYYCGVEVIPSALVLSILRKLPPKRTNSYQAIPTSDPGQPSGATPAAA